MATIENIPKQQAIKHVQSELGSAQDIVYTFDCEWIEGEPGRYTRTKKRNGRRSITIEYFIPENLEPGGYTAS